MNYANAEAQEREKSNALDLCPYNTERDEFVRIYEKHWSWLLGVATKKLNDKDIAEELVQDIFADLWKKKNFSNILNMEGYLSTALKFSIIDFIRHRSAQKSYLEYHRLFQEARSEREQILDYEDIPKLIDESMTDLSDTTREIFKLSHLLDWKKDKIADYFQLSEKAIEYHLTKSLKTVKMYLRSISF